MTNVLLRCIKMFSYVDDTALVDLKTRAFFSKQQAASFNGESNPIHTNKLKSTLTSVWCVGLDLNLNYHIYVYKWDKNVKYTLSMCDVINIFNEESSGTCNSSVLITVQIQWCLIGLCEKLSHSKQTCIYYEFPSFGVFFLVDLLIWLFNLQVFSIS